MKPVGKWQLGSSGGIPGFPWEVGIPSIPGTSGALWLPACWAVLGEAVAALSCCCCVSDTFPGSSGGSLGSRENPQGPPRVRCRGARALESCWLLGS